MNARRLRNGSLLSTHHDVRVDQPHEVTDRRIGLWLLSFFCVFLPGQVHAESFGLGFSSAYQFRNSNDRAVRAGVVDLIERKKAGQFQAPIFNTTNTTNIEGDQINCDVVSTSIGNSGSAINEGDSGAPNVLNAPEVKAESTGNVSDGEAGGALNAGEGGGTNQVSSQQSVDDSTQTSNVGDTTQGGVTGDVGNSDNSLRQNSSNEQAINGSSLNSTVADSSACSWW